ncbi:hypothetical protein F0562_028005 [Nyssa sinensis]|uniref:Response regulatory domain-containing protein n=1 Tax=Nyssa sinensis TaxID=561372 RepID=A0A5J5B6Y4_9ASTE|nr:hypothetical protein F0562_028005 [Nyssa sinensis]
MDLNSSIGDSTQEEEHQQQQQQKQHFHVLAVDDNLIDRKLLERLLTVSSYQVTCVESGNKALEYLGLLDNTDNNSCNHLCFFFLSIFITARDYSMPGMSGYDLLKRVKGSSWKHVPVVVMSSENVPSRINMCLEGGAEEFLLKPVQLSDLRKLQSHLLNPLNNSCRNIDTNFVDTENNNNNNSDKNSNNANKRKAISPEPSDRRPKMKELAVI